MAATEEAFILNQQQPKTHNCRSKLANFCLLGSKYNWFFYSSLSLLLSLFGGWIFYHCEYDHEHTQIAQKMQYNQQMYSFMRQHNANGSILAAYEAMITEMCGVPMDKADNRWSYGSSTFFAFTTASTIGYGFTTPQTDAGRLFTFIYGLPAIALCGLSMMQIGATIVSRIDKRQQQRTRCKCLSKGNRTMAVLLMLSVVILLGAFILKRSEIGDTWTWSDGVYFMWISVSTIGYGDLQPSLKEGKWLFVLALIWCGLVFTVMLIGSIQDWTSDAVKRWKVKHGRVEQDEEKEVDELSVHEESGGDRKDVNKHGHSIMNWHKDQKFEI